MLQQQIKVKAMEREPAVFAGKCVRVDPENGKYDGTNGEFYKVRNDRMFALSFENSITGDIVLFPDDLTVTLCA